MHKLCKGGSTCLAIDLKSNAAIVDFQVSNSFLLSAVQENCMPACLSIIIKKLFWVLQGEFHKIAIFDSKLSRNISFLKIEINQKMLDVPCRKLKDFQHDV